jgi:hypothetical protein
VIVVVLTDGQENASLEYTLEDVRKQITERTAHGWKFVFLGAAQDAWEQARTMGVPMSGTAQYAATAGGTGMAMAAASSQVMGLRRTADPSDWEPDIDSVVADSSSGEAGNGS